VDGVCGRQTWGAVVEAGFRLGDRFLYLHAPMFRGDDVADLQQRLSASVSIRGGSTASTEGSRRRRWPTSSAMSALPVDGHSGRLHLARAQTGHASTRRARIGEQRADRERLRQAPRTLLGRRLAIGEEGGLDVLVTAVRRHLAATGAEVVPLVHPDGSLQAAAANAAQVEAYVGLRLDPDRTRCSASYYAGYSYESAGGRRLAELLQSLAAIALEIPADGVQGMSLPVLRETRMPAVICEVGPPATVVKRAGALAHAIVEALTIWAVTPVD